MDIAEIKKEVARIVREELAAVPGVRGYQAFFFGSRISGTASPSADLDVGIEGKEPLPAAILRAMQSRTEALRTLITIDIVDFATVSEAFKEVAKANIEHI